MDASLLELDPTISPDLVQAAHDDPGDLDYQAVFDAIAARLAQDDVDELGAGAADPATPPEALGHARQLHLRDTYVGVGYCLRTVRDPEFRVAALWPDAATAWEHGGALGHTRHLEADPAKHPRGSVGYGLNDDHGHVWLNVGGGLCWTTDKKRPGYVDLVPTSTLPAWFGGRIVGWAEILNGVDVWPGEVRRPTTPFGLLEKERLIHNALQRAIANKAHKRRIDGLRAWDQHLLARLDASND